MQFCCGSGCIKGLGLLLLLHRAVRLNRTFNLVDDDCFVWNFDLIDDNFLEWTFELIDSDIFAWSFDFIDDDHFWLNFDLIDYDGFRWNFDLIDNDWFVLGVFLTLHILSMHSLMVRTLQSRVRVTCAWNLEYFINDTVFLCHWRALCFNNDRLTKVWIL